MLKFLHVTWISNFRIFLINLSPDFKHVILSHLNKLLNLQYMVRNLQMFSFHHNFIRGKIPPVAPDISQTVHEGLVW
jgi:hypothetical protein